MKVHAGSLNADVGIIRSADVVDVGGIRYGQHLTNMATADVQRQYPVAVACAGSIAVFRGQNSILMKGGYHMATGG